MGSIWCRLALPAENRGDVGGFGKGDWSDILTEMRAVLMMLEWVSSGITGECEVVWRSIGRIKGYKDI